MIDKRGQCFEQENKSIMESKWLAALDSRLEEFARLTYSGCHNMMTQKNTPAEYTRSEIQVET
ncbi:hypothetical protein Leryth_027537 [Lithospermum erythrorhizon]|nr:hypothetical protein Leryth_027537 [Lithospermum erythrorhizon]